jgi:hypothetical protein
VGAEKALSHKKQRGPIVVIGPLWKRTVATLFLEIKTFCHMCVPPSLRWSADPSHSFPCTMTHPPNPVNRASLCSPSLFFQQWFQRQCGTGLNQDEPLLPQFVFPRTKPPMSRCARRNGSSPKNSRLTSVARRSATIRCMASGSGENNE